MTLKPHQLAAFNAPLANGRDQLPARFFTRFKGELLSVIFSLNK